MDRIEALSTFVAVAENGGFARAARALNLSPAAVTRIIAALEDTLGASLLQRSTRSVRLTEDEQLLFEQAREILQKWNDTEQLIKGRQEEPSGELHVTAPVMFGRLHVLPVINRLLAEHPDLRARMLLLDRNIRLVEEGIDVAVRIGELADSSLMRTGIGTVRQVIVASPQYLARNGAPKGVEDIKNHQIIDNSHVRTAGQWRFGDKSETVVPVRHRLSINTLDGVIDAAKAGVGLANLLDYQVAGELAAGTLQCVLEHVAPPPLPVSLLYTANRANNPAVRAFVKAMRQARAEALAR